MAILHLFEQEKNQDYTETFDMGKMEAAGRALHSGQSSRWFSTLITRFCFFLLLLGDLAWLGFNLVKGALSLLAVFLTGGKHSFSRKLLNKSFLNIRRGCVCFLALFVGLFSPPFGIMVGCTYFLMYDKKGMEEVVPAPLQAQFKDIFNPEK